MAGSWKGDAGERAVLDMSVEEGFSNEAQDETALTERGLQIIAGPNGIAETAKPVNFTGP